MPALRWVLRDITSRMDIGTIFNSGGWHFFVANAEPVPCIYDGFKSGRFHCRADRECGARSHRHKPGSKRLGAAGGVALSGLRRCKQRLRSVFSSLWSNCGYCQSGSRSNSAAAVCPMLAVEANPESPPYCMLLDGRNICRCAYPMCASVLCHSF